MKNPSIYVWGLLFFVALLFSKQILRVSYIGWDTFDVYTVNFIYFSDCLRSGYFPLWNPFVLSGVPLYPNLFVASLYNPFDLFFLFLSLFIHPIYAVDLSVLFGVFIGGLGFFSLITQNGNSQGTFFQFVITCCFIAIIFPPVVGQLSFVYSYAMLPWLLQFVEKLRKNPHMSFGTTLIRGILISFLFAKGYFYLNICAGLFSGLYFLLNYKHFKSKFAAGCARFLIFIGPSLILYILLNLDGLIQLKELYSGLNGDLFVPEPRIRSLKTNVYYYFEGGWETILSFISAKLVKTGSWLTGLLYMTPFFLVALFGIRRTELKDPIIRLSLGLLGFGFLMSYKSFLAVMINNHVPIFNSNRWSHVNLIFAEIGALIIIAVILREKWNSSSSFLLSSLKKCALVILLLSNYLFFNGEIKEQRSYSELEKATNFSDRPIYPSITQNNRRLGVSQDFSIYDIRWLTEKAPFTHGYFNTVHYIYWYLKDALFLEKLVNFQSTYKVELPIPSKIKSDNKMVQFRLDQVDTTGSQYLLLNDTPGIASQRTPFYQVEEFLILPNEARFKVSTQGAGLFTFYNQWAPGWVAHVNGVESKIFLANLLFKAVELPEQGIYEISFKYKPVTIKFLYIYYSIIALFFLGYLYKKNFR